MKPLHQGAVLMEARELPPDSLELTTSDIYYFLGMLIRVDLLLLLVCALPRHDALAVHCVRQGRGRGPEDGPEVKS